LAQLLGTGVNIGFEWPTTCAQQGIWEYKFNVSDDWNYTYEVYGGSFTVEKRGVILAIQEGAGIVIPREGGYARNLTVLVTDQVSSQLVGSGVNGTFWIETKTGWFEVNVTTNASGQLVYPFNPDCNYNVGKITWIAGVRGDACYADTNTTSSLNVTGQLKNNLQLPPEGSVYNVTQLIPIRFNTTSDCVDEGLIANATSFSIELISPLGETEICSPAYNEYNGYYNCTWNSTGKKEGYWSIRLNATKMPYYYFNSSLYTNRFWLENLKATSENATIWIFNYSTNSWEDLAGRTVGWSRMFNYTIDIYDQEGDTINCTLYISKDNQASWIEVGTYQIVGTPGIPTRGTCSIVYHGFAAEDIGNDNWFKWEIKNGEPANYYNTTPINAPNLTKSIVNVSYVKGNDTLVNRSDLFPGNINELILRVFDLENNTYVPAGVNVSFWVTNDRSNYVLTNVTTTNSSGYAIALFNPDCSFLVGQQYWIGGVANDVGYKDTNTTSNFTMRIIGSLFLNLTQPQGEKYLRGSNVTIRGSIIDDCNLPISTASVNFTSIHVDSKQQFICSPTLNEGDGYYNCTFNTSYPIVVPARWYSVNFTANLTNYNTNSTIFTNRFWIETKPILTAPRILQPASYSGGWGETWIFAVNISDEDLDTLTVNLYTNTSTGGAWELKGSNSSVSGVNVTVTFTLPSPAFSSALANSWRMFKFNVSENVVDFAENVNETSPVNFFIEKDDVSITHEFGNNTVVDRSDSSSTTYFVARLTDTDRNLVVPSRSLNFYATKNVSQPNNFSSIGDALTNSNGVANLTFNLYSRADRCEFEVGPQRWKAGLAGQADLKDANSTDFFFTIVTVPLDAKIMYPVSGEIYRRGPVDFDTITIRANVTDDCGLVKGASVNIYVEQGGIVYYSCTSAIDEGNGSYRCMIAPDTTWPLGYYNLTINATKQYYNSSATITYVNAFRLVSQPELTSSSVSSYSVEATSDGGWNETWKFSVNLRDLDIWANDQINVSLWVNLTGNWQLLNSTLVTATGGTQTIVFEGHRFSPSNIGVRYFKFNASDIFSTKNETSISSFTITKDEAETYLQPSDSSVNREDQSKALLRVVVRDLDSGIYLYEGVNVSFWITTNASDSSSFDSGIINTTDANGEAKYYFDPNCSYSVGTQTWRAGVFNDYRFVEFGVNASSTITIYGQLKNELTQPIYGSIFNVTQLIPINFTTLSDCSNERADENPVINASSYTIELRSPLGAWGTCVSS